jgi:hypothetical protein
MGLIKKFDSFISEKLVAEVEPVKTVSKPVETQLSKEAAAQQVIDRLSRIYKELPADKKEELDKYFQ